MEKYNNYTFDDFITEVPLVGVLEVDVIDIGITAKIWYASRMLTIAYGEGRNDRIKALIGSVPSIKIAEDSSGQYLRFPELKVSEDMYELLRAANIGEFKGYGLLVRAMAVKYPSLKNFRGFAWDNIDGVTPEQWLTFDTICGLADGEQQAVVNEKNLANQDSEQVKKLTEQVTSLMERIGALNKDIKKFKAEKQSYYKKIKEYEDTITGCNLHNSELQSQIMAYHRDSLEGTQAYDLVYRVISEVGFVLPSYVSAVPRWYLARVVIAESGPDGPNWDETIIPAPEQYGFDITAFYNNFLLQKILDSGNYDARHRLFKQVRDPEKLIRDVVAETCSSFGLVAPLVESVNNIESYLKKARISEVSVSTAKTTLTDEAKTTISSRAAELLHIAPTPQTSGSAVAGTSGQNVQQAAGPQVRRQAPEVTDPALQKFLADREKRRAVQELLQLSQQPPAP